MKVSCPACDSKYTIADEKVTGRKVKVRCKSCGGQILVDGTGPMPATSDDASDDNDATKVFTSAERTAFDTEHGVSAEVSPELAGAPGGGIVWSVNVSETDERSMTTDELVASYLAGELEGEVYVWHDTLTDWSLIADVPELVSAIDAKRAVSQPKGSKPKSITPEPKSAPQSAPGSAPKPGLDGPSATGTAGKTPAPAAAQAKKALPTAGKLTTSTAAGTGPKAAARAATAKRPQSAHDLFSAASQVGEDVDVSVTQSDEEQRKTGARNESSVLFSLDALKAGIAGTAPAQAPAQRSTPGRKGPPTAPKKKLEDLMSNAAPAPTVLGQAGGPLMLSSNQALLTAPAPPPPKPEPKPVAVAAAPTSPSTAGSAAQPAFAIPEPPKKKKKGLVIGIAALVAVAIAAGLAVALTSHGDEKPVASAVTAEPPAPKPAPTPEPAKTEPPPAPETAASASAQPSAAPPPSAAPVAVAGNGASGGPKTGGGAVKPAETPKETKKSEPSGPVSSGVASFNKDSAIQALNVAASQASSCKKPDGPTGTGKVQVTFAPSGRATTANVISGPFGGTPVGGCVSSVFRRARVPPFAGDPVTVSKSFSIIP